MMEFRSIVFSLGSWCLVGLATIAHGNAIDSNFYLPLTRDEVKLAHALAKSDGSSADKIVRGLGSSAIRPLMRITSAHRIQGLSDSQYGELLRQIEFILRKNPATNSARIMKLMRTDDTSGYSVDWLNRLMPESIPIMERDAGTLHGEARFNVMDALGAEAYLKHDAFLAQRVARELIEQFDSPLSLDRYTSIICFQRLRGFFVGPLLTPMLWSTNRLKRQCAARALEVLLDDVTAPDLIKVVSAGPVDVRTAAIETLGQLSADTSLQVTIAAALRKSAGSSDARIATAAIEAGRRKRLSWWRHAAKRMLASNDRAARRSAWTLLHE